MALPLPGAIIEHAHVSSMSLFHRFEPHPSLDTGLDAQSIPGTGLTSEMGPP